MKRLGPTPRCFCKAPEVVETTSEDLVCWSPASFVFRYLELEFRTAERLANSKYDLLD
jgi:hypothetical protein